jgi:hypothetical protein
VVPNPYYAYSNYEFDKLDNVVKIVNLPDICTVNIYTVSGTLVRSYNKDSPVTSIDWDLKNFAGIPIASGVYLIHINVPGVCEKVLKWFGVIRPPDLDNVGPPMSFSGDGLSIDMLNPSTSISIGMQQRVASFELPSQLNIGASYDFNFNENQKLTFAGSFSANSFSKDQFRTGAEYTLVKQKKHLSH